MSAIGAIIKFIIVILILFAGYQLILKYSPFGNSKENFETPAPAMVPPTLPAQAVAGPRTIQPGGPSTPTQAAPLDSVRIVAPPAATDPYAEPNEDANAPEKLRYPERMFRPAPEMDAVDMIRDSGIGGMAQQATANASQTFAPDFAQNGGEFMGSVFANDTDVPTNFSDF
jgi:hypothetical protein